MKHTRHCRLPQPSFKPPNRVRLCCNVTYGLNGGKGRSDRLLHHLPKAKRATLSASSTAKTLLQGQVVLVVYHGRVSALGATTAARTRIRVRDCRGAGFARHGEADYNGVVFAPRAPEINRGSTKRRTRLAPRLYKKDANTLRLTC